MTREDIFKLLNKHQDNDTLDIKTAKEMVNIIFDEHEAQLREAMKPKTCEGCRLENDYAYNCEGVCDKCLRNSEDKYVSKDNV